MEIPQLQELDTNPFLDRLSFIYADMDQEYSKAADHYGFNCSGCSDICCQTRFFHHTYLEYLYVQAGFQTLSPVQQEKIMTVALSVEQQSAALNKIGKSVRLMCPLNIGKLCVLYRYRPMICRLHGIPHELKKGVDKRVFGPGCETFDDRCPHKPYFQFDRTPFYHKLAALEKELRQAYGISSKIKMTIAEIITTI